MVKKIAKKFPINTTGTLKTGILDNIENMGDLDYERSEARSNPSAERWIEYLDLHRLNKLSKKQNESFDDIVLEDEDLDWNRAQRKKKPSKSKTRKPVKKCKCK